MWNIGGESRPSYADGAHTFRPRLARAVLPITIMSNPLDWSSSAENSREPIPNRQIFDVPFAIYSSDFRSPQEAGRRIYVHIKIDGPSSTYLDASLPTLFYPLNRNIIAPRNINCY